MKKATLLIIVLISTLLNAQSNFNLLFKEGKEEFSKEFSEQNYANAANKLEQAVKLKPANAEAHYYLAYAYSRLNSKDGKGMINMTLNLTLKCSNELETVTKLTPKYKGRVIALDPYSKLSAEWGSLAMCYWHNNQKDSALWAFAEGKKRGGFGNFFLSTNRKILDLCTKNAFLMTSGDNLTIPLWYLQIVENYRTDVKVIDAGLLNANWYADFLTTKSNISFGLSKEIIDTLDYCPWTDSTVVIRTDKDTDFSWVVKPSYLGNYILRGDRLFLSLLQENKFKNDVYFTTAFIEDFRLSLKDKLSSLILIDKINHSNQTELNFDEYQAQIIPILNFLKQLNPNSQDELSFMDAIRYNILQRIYNCLQTDDKKQARQLLKIIEDYGYVTIFPFQSIETLKGYKSLIQAAK